MTFLLYRIVAPFLLLTLSLSNNQISAIAEIWLTGVLLTFYSLLLPSPSP